MLKLQIGQILTVKIWPILCCMLVSCYHDKFGEFIFKFGWGKACEWNCTWFTKMFITIAPDLWNSFQLCIFCKCKICTKAASLTVFKIKIIKKELAHDCIHVWIENHGINIALSWSYRLIIECFKLTNLLKEIPR